MTTPSHTERVVKDALRYSVRNLDRLPEPRWWYSDLDRSGGFVRRLAGMTLAPGQHGAPLEDALHAPKTLARLVLAQYTPVVQCPLEASVMETEAEARANPWQAKALKNPTKENLSKTLEMLLDQRVHLDRCIHAIAHALGQQEPTDSLWRAAS